MRENVEAWFNSGMDRVSGWYKRRTQLIIFILGLVVASVFNLDSIAIVRKLYVDKSARDVVVSAAENYVKTHPSGPTKNAAPAGTATDSTAPGANTGTGATNDMSGQLAAPLSELEKVAVPFGWKTGVANANDTVPSFSEDKTYWLLKVIGLLLTALAASLGAAFWFDILNKIIVVRSTVKPSEKSPNEASKS